MNSRAGEARPNLFRVVGKSRSVRTPPPLGWTGAKGEAQGGQRPAGFALSRKEAEGQQRVVRRDI